MIRLQLCLKTVWQSMQVAARMWTLRGSQPGGVGVARARQLQHFVAAHKQPSQSATYRHVHRAGVGVCVSGLEVVCVSGLGVVCVGGYIVYTGNFRQLEVATG